jgi:hypothetical protein
MEDASGLIHLLLLVDAELTGTHVDQQKETTTTDKISLTV